MLILILIAMFSVPDLNESKFERPLEQKKIQIDTINFWHIILDDSILLKANHFIEESDLEISISESDIPEFIECVYQTDHGLEYMVDKEIQIFDRNDTLLQKFQLVTKNYDTVFKLYIGNLLRERKELKIKCKFFLIKEKADIYIKKKSIQMKKYINPSDSEAFLLFKLILK